MKKKMKQYIIPFYGLIALVVSTLSACNKQLDLRPENILVEEQLLEDKVTTERLLAGGFEAQFEAESSVFTMADQSTGIAYLDANNYYLGNIDANNTVALKIWTLHYKVINIANVIINNLPKHAKFDITLQKQFIAEAKFLRAFGYMRLAVLYGEDALTNDQARGVPLRLNAFDRSDASQIIPRTANKLVFDQVVKDLEEAIPDLPTSYPEAQATFADVKLRSRAVKSVGRAFLSRVYLYLKNYDGVVTNANLVLGDASYVLAPTPAEVFPNNSTVKTVSANIPFNKEVVYGYPLSWSTYEIPHRFGYIADPAFVQTYTVNDMRGKTMIIPSTVPVGKLTTSKYTSPNYYDNIMVIRLAEVMLNKAEALARKDGVNQTSVDILNAIYQRAFTSAQKPALYTLTSFASKEQLVSRILQERRWELAFEGQDRFDRQRSGLAINPVLPANRVAFPIPKSEIDITSGVLTQNTDY
ncbi:RagB/SusD family nutrient uptake outer membrane protein [Pedobacter frigoris]|uniref:RagB/SusD family nutrient uptake outer membrane protein n=1 Tax=Pedobacter frigoris TaxID=2571272 RepID=UPI0029306546|nr:RagB/SusD family nutrient uptake outer membrane protein [Pedobacter frigoris]